MVEIDLTTLSGWNDLPDGEYQITVGATAEGYSRINQSAAVSVTKGEPVGDATYFFTISDRTVVLEEIASSMPGALQSFMGVVTAQAGEPVTFYKTVGDITQSLSVWPSGGDAGNLEPENPDVQNDVFYVKQSGADLTIYFTRFEDENYTVWMSGYEPPVPEGDDPQDSEYSICVNYGERYYNLIQQPEPDMFGRQMWLASNKSFETGDTVEVYDRDNDVTFSIPLNAGSTGFELQGDIVTCNLDGDYDVYVGFKFADDTLYITSAVT